MSPYARNAWTNYRQVAIRTAPPGQLVLMLYDGAIRFLECALTGFDCTDPAERNSMINNNILRAADIIRELNGCLDTDAGGDLAQTLRSLYLYMERRLTESNLKKQHHGLNEVISQLKELRAAWARMLTQWDHALPTVTHD